MLIGITKAREAAEVLGLELLGLSNKAVTKAYRDKAKLCHPDHHGTNQLTLWSRVSWAKEVLTHWVKANPPEENTPDEALEAGDCRACAGTGRVDVRRTGFASPLKMQCVMCRGLGTIIPEEHDSD